MNPAELSALAALAGSALGGITPLISNIVVQRGLMNRELLSRELAQRQKVYGEFIRFGAKVYVEATTTRLDKLDELVCLYALVGSIRLIGSDRVIEAAEEFAQLVARKYGEDNLTVEDLREATVSPHVDPLHKFSQSCRSEIHRLVRFGLKAPW